MPLIKGWSMTFMVEIWQCWEHFGVKKKAEEGFYLWSLGKRSTENQKWLTEFLVYSGREPRVLSVRMCQAARHRNPYQYTNWIIFCDWKSWCREGFETDCVKSQWMVFILCWLQNLLCPGTCLCSSCKIALADAVGFTVCIQKDMFGKKFSPPTVSWKCSHFHFF